MSYKILIPIRRDGDEVWLPVHPSGGSPYQFTTYEEARRMARMCYPEHRFKVKEVTSWRASIRPQPTVE